MWTVLRGQPWIPAHALQVERCKLGHILTLRQLHEVESLQTCESDAEIGPDVVGTRVELQGSHVRLRSVAVVAEVGM